jgi:hypothetical protein
MYVGVGAVVQLVFQYFLSINSPISDIRPAPNQKAKHIDQIVGSSVDNDISPLRLTARGVPGHKVGIATHTKSSGGYLVEMWCLLILIKSRELVIG